MTALEQLGAFVAHSGVPSPRLREILELHVVDIVGAWIASLPTPEGAALLRWRAASGEGAAPGSIHRLRLDVATHCALARLSEVDDIHLASTTTPGAIVVPGAVAVAAALRNRDPDALAAAMIAGYEVMVRFGRRSTAHQFSIAASGRLTSQRPWASPPSRPASSISTRSSAPTRWRWRWYGPLPVPDIIT